MVSANAYPVMGGVETHLHEVAPRIVRAGFEVTILTTDRSGKLPTRDRDDGVEIRRVRAWPAERDYYVAPGIYRAITGASWDLLHCHGYQTFVPPLALVAALRARIPYVLTFHSGGHGSRVRTRLRGAQQMALRPLLARAKRLIAVSEFEARVFPRRLRIPASRFVTIPNGAAIDWAPDPASFPEDESLILSVGRLERYKGHHRVISALPHLIGELPGVHLRIVGSGPYEPELRRLAEALGVEERVEIGGIDPRDRAGMASLLARAGLVTLLSEYESQGIAVMEALALRRRVLLADTTALTELARRGWARAIPRESTPEQIASAMLAQLRAPPPDNLALPTWDDCAHRIADVYRSALKSARQLRARPGD
jgi:glycosyltransferase involved in cell wall biosynthesis